MDNELRRRVPWRNNSAIADAMEGEEVELETFQGSGGAEEALLEIEEIGAELDATGEGLPLGLVVGGLGLLGYGVYKAYEILKHTDPKITLEQVRQHHGISYHEFNKRKEQYEKSKTPVDFVPLENQFADADFIPLEDQNIDKQGWVPHPYKYLGPGNSLDRGAPYNQIDEDAEKHDKEYNVAANKYDIFLSDTDFLKRVGDHIAESLAGKSSIGDAVGAIAGGVGIGAKHLAEKTLDKTLYPSFSGKSWLLQIEQPLLLQRISVLIL